MSKAKLQFNLPNLLDQQLQLLHLYRLRTKLVSRQQHQPRVNVASSNDMRQYSIQPGSNGCQHKESDFQKSAITHGSQNRFCRSTVFATLYSRTGKKFKRNWLCYSKLTERVYCFICKLMFDKVSKLTSDFNHWKKAREALVNQENPRQHLDSMEACVLESQLVGKLILVW